MEEYRPPATLTETIYLHLKKALFEGEFKPGQRLQDKIIAEKLKVSVTPVRAALVRLAAEKYLINNARHEVLVNTHSYPEILDLYELIRVLDFYVIKKILKDLTKDELLRLKEMTQELGHHYKSRDLPKYMGQNLKIHDEIWKQCKNNAIYETLATKTERLYFFTKDIDFTQFPDHASFKKSYKDHLRLIELLEKRDLRQIEILIQSHWGEISFPVK